jgi:hypothetical protein
MEAVVAIALVAALVFAIGSIGAMSIDRAVSALAQAFGGWRGDGWPRGVQEEDPDRPWGALAPAATNGSRSIPPEPKPKLMAVKPGVRQR